MTSMSNFDLIQQISKTYNKLEKDTNNLENLDKNQLIDINQRVESLQRQIRYAIEHSDSDSSTKNKFLYFDDKVNGLHEKVDKWIQTNNTKGFAASEQAESDQKANTAVPSNLRNVNHTQKFRNIFQKFSELQNMIDPNIESDIDENYLANTFTQEQLIPFIEKAKKIDEEFTKLEKEGFTIDEATRNMVTDFINKLEDTLNKCIKDPEKARRTHFPDLSDKKSIPKSDSKQI